jgi:hypothetical protein
MRELVECFQEWLALRRTDANAYSLCVGLAAETLKRADSSDPGQREFDAQDLAAAAGRTEADDFEASKRWVDRADLQTFVDARRQDLEAHFRDRGHTRCLRVERRSPGGRHRAVWYLQAYELAPSTEVDSGSTEPVSEKQPGETRYVVQYDLTLPNMIKPSWLARVLIGSGSFVTRSARGALWMSIFLLLIAVGVMSALTTLGFVYVRRPLQTSDLASLFVLFVTVWLVWLTFLRPMVWLVEDRIILATELWVAWGEENAQLELSKGSDNKTRLQLVRFSAVCPICAGTVHLRYSQGPNRRRLIGCCDEAPHDHVFSFDRVLRRGGQLQSR